MKPFSFTCIIFLCVTGISTAQDKSSGNVNLTNQLTSLCRLSPEQLAKAQPLISDFEQKRDETYMKYRHNPAELKKQVKQNRWDYETSMIGTLNPSQMGLLKVFDQRNTELMTHATSHVEDVSYFADNGDNTNQTTVAATTAVAATVSDVKPVTVSVPVVSDNARGLTSTDAILTDAVKNFCKLSPDQFAQAAPVLADFELKRDSIYQLYKDDKTMLNSAVRRNRLNYEVALVEILDAGQMRALRAFNLCNRQLMSGSGTAVNGVDFIPGVASVSDDKHPIIKSMDATNAEGIQITTQSDEVADTKKNSAEEINLTDELKDLCNLTPEQLVKAGPIIGDFEKKRDETYQKYHHTPSTLAKIAKQNRWDYEVSLIGIFNPSQMGLLKVFDQRNPELMTHASSTVVDVSYFADSK